MSSNINYVPNTPKNIHKVDVMHNLKLGIIQKIIENPNINLVELIQDELDLPFDKAEVLAERIEKQHLQTINNIEQKRLQIVIEKPANPKHQNPKSLYALESLSNKEFETFTKWLLQELAYNICPENFPALMGVDYVATKDGFKTVILARKYPVNCVVTEAAVLMAQEAKQNYKCDEVIILVTVEFSERAKLMAKKWGVELWDAKRLEGKILEVKQQSELEVQYVFPQYRGTLVDSLFSLVEFKKFLIEQRGGKKYDLFFLGVKFPLLTFQVENNVVVKLVYRVRYNEPVGENEGEALISCDKSGSRYGPADVEAYLQVTEYLEQFLV